MRIDCESCPGRPAACGDCMMNVLMADVAPPEQQGSERMPTIGEQRADLLVAISNMRAAGLVTQAEARAAAGRIAPRHGEGGNRFLSIVRAG
ncbi:hypothetical protein GOARA_089_00220 [Gordonia araii NBRC 100433]|uniref:Uncharacterized protein n=1 Tax=Gordonia araii NBRC 100433 TaxID=1073574 RepID=G7H7L5_9ACTN|nr:hypothetical protein GOARA_089_00220 [Gordonia araii NBRC 100433]